MADLPTDFWGGWIAILTSVSFVALGWLIFSIYFSAGDDTRKQKARSGTKTCARARTQHRCGGSG